MEFLKVLKRFSLKSLRGISCRVSSENLVRQQRDFLCSSFLCSKQSANRNLRSLFAFFFPYAFKICIDIDKRKAVQWASMCQRMKFLKDIAMDFSYQGSGKDIKNDKHLESLLSKSLKRLRYLESFKTKSLLNCASKDFLNQINDALFKCIKLASVQHFYCYPMGSIYWDFLGVTKNFMKCLIESSYAFELKKIRLEFGYPSIGKSEFKMLRDICLTVPRRCPNTHFLEILLSHRFPENKIFDGVQTVCDVVQAYNHKPYLKISVDPELSRKICGDACISFFGSRNLKGYETDGLKSLKKAMRLLGKSGVNVLTFKTEPWDRGVCKESIKDSLEPATSLESLNALEIPCFFPKLVNCKAKKLRSLSIKAPQIFNKAALECLKYLECSALEEFSLVGSAGFSQDILSCLFDYLKTLPIKKLSIDSTIFSAKPFPGMQGFTYNFLVYHVQLLQGLPYSIEKLDVPVYLEDLEEILKEFPTLRQIHVVAPKTIWDPGVTGGFAMIQKLLSQFPRVSQVVINLGKPSGEQLKKKGVYTKLCLGLINPLNALGRQTFLQEQVFLQAQTLKLASEKDSLPVFGILRLGPYHSLANK